MKNKKLDDIASNSVIFTIVALLIIAAVTFIENIFLAVALIVVTIIIGYLNIKKNIKRRRELTHYVEQLSLDIDQSAQRAILNLPTAFLIVEQSGKILWYNQTMSDIFDGVQLIDKNINNIITGLSLEKLIEQGQIEQRIAEHYYRLERQLLTSQSDQKRQLINIYFYNITAYKQLKMRYDDRQPTIAIMQVDNYDDVINETKEDRRPFIKSEIDKKINLWSSRMNGILKKIDKDKYIAIFEHKYLSILEAKRFAILDEIRSIDLGNRIAPMLSIGVATGGGSLSQVEESAASALELALGRGGDQAVLKKQGDFEFYGGKTKAVEKRNKVKARIIAHALRPIIDESQSVYIMGHTFPDMDSYGSAIGIYQAAINRGKTAYIVLKEANETISAIHEKFVDDDSFHFITPDEALAAFNDEDLLIIVDTHRPSFTESPELEARALRKVLIDHHRRGKEFIENTLLTYLEPYASSASELVTEVLQYMERKMMIEKRVAEALLAGIYVDTKNFTVKTGVRTFESAALLRRFDADTTAVKALFKDDLESFVARSNIVSNAEMVFSEIALSTSDEEIANGRLIGAQGADSLLNIRGVKASFVLVRVDDEIYMSGRSHGDINVQLIAEKLGGGGHLTGSGAQFKDITMAEAKAKLLDTLKQYYQEAE